MEELLSKMSFIPTNISKGIAPNQTFFKEIPMGTLAETVLSRTISCYDYDDMGDPITNEVKTDGRGTVDGPTFLDHDRVDCLLKLNLAIEKKSKIIKLLSEEIAGLMEDCSCSKVTNNGKNCKEVEGTKCPDSYSVQRDEDCSCGSGLKCECDGGNPNMCEPDDNQFKLCRAGTKKFVQEGPITLDTVDIRSGISKAEGNGQALLALDECMDDKLSA
jgi:hypothetical protein